MPAEFFTTHSRFHHLLVAMSLPSRADFIAQSLRPFNMCPICREPLGSNHVAVGFSGPNTCEHIFGEECLL